MAPEDTRLTDESNVSLLVGEQAYTDTDPRLRLLLTLLEAGKINVQDVNHVMSWTASDPQNVEAVVGLVAGEVGVAPADISKALEGSEWTIDPATVEERSKQFDDYRHGISGSAHDAAEVFRNYMAWPVEAVKQFGESTVWGESGYYGQERQDERTSRDNAIKLIEREFDLLKDQGYITSKKKDELLAPLLRNYSPAQYQEVYNELHRIYSGMEDIDSAEAHRQNDVLTAIQREGGDSINVTGSRMTGGGDRRFTPEGDPVTRDDEGNILEVDGPEDGDDFIGWGGLDGLGTDGTATLETLPRASFLDGYDFILDRSTGQTYSPDEWNAIKRNPDARAAYEANKVVAPAVQAALDQPFFREQVGGAPDLGYTTPQIPIEDLQVSSPSPTNPWETSSFDYKKGGGYAEWASFTPRQRAFRLKMMHDQGLISDEEMDAMGGVTRSRFIPGMGVVSMPGGGDAFNLTAMKIWEGAVGFASQFQTDPLQAIKSMGEAKRVGEARTTVTYRGSSGRSAPTYSVPSSLRTIPDYKALAQESKKIFTDKVGRDMEDWELHLAADELAQEYGRRNDAMIEAHKEWWNDSIAGGTTEIDYSDVPDPAASLQYDIEEKYAAELGRQERVEDRAANNRLLLDSITAGQRMI